jgi:hypothetical protein
LLACTQVPSATLKHMDASGNIQDITTDELCAGKKVRRVVLQLDSQQRSCVVP